MKKIFAKEYFSPEEKVVKCIHSSSLLGTAFTIDAHSIRYSLSTPFFLRR